MRRTAALFALLELAVCPSVACQQLDFPAPAASRPAPPPCHPAPAPATGETARPCLSPCAVTQAEERYAVAAVLPLAPVPVAAPQTLLAWRPSSAAAGSAPEERYLRFRVLRL